MSEHILSETGRLRQIAGTIQIFHIQAVFEIRTKKKLMIGNEDERLKPESFLWNFASFRRAKSAKFGVKYVERHWV